MSTPRLVPCCCPCLAFQKVWRDKDNKPRQEQKEKKQTARPHLLGPVLAGRVSEAPARPPLSPRGGASPFPLPLYGRGRTRETHLTCKYEKNSNSNQLGQRGRGRGRTWGAG